MVLLSLLLMLLVVAIVLLLLRAPAFKKTVVSIATTGPQTGRIVQQPYA